MEAHTFLRILLAGSRPLPSCANAHARANQKHEEPCKNCGTESCYKQLMPHSVAN